MCCFSMAMNLMGFIHLVVVFHAVLLLLQPLNTLFCCFSRDKQRESRPRKIMKLSNMLSAVVVVSRTEIASKSVRDIKTLTSDFFLAHKPYLLNPLSVLI
jgi:hypothetical protein